MAGTLHAFLVLLPLLQPAHADRPSLNSFLFNYLFDFIDLSHPFDNNTVYWPGNRKFEFTKQTKELIGDDNSWYAANEFAAAEHGGTHIDAPNHFSKGGHYVGEIPLEKLIVPMTILDVSAKVKDNPNFVLTKGDLNYLVSDSMGESWVMIFKFGWSKFYNTSKYLGIDEQTKTFNFPGLNPDAIQWLINYRPKIVGIGVDVASVDPGSSKDFPVHKLLSRAGLYIMENVNLISPVPAAGCTSIAMPMKIAQGTGAPLRLVAICPRASKDIHDY